MNTNLLHDIFAAAHNNLDMDFDIFDAMGDEMIRHGLTIQGCEEASEIASEMRGNLYCFRIAVGDRGYVEDEIIGFLLQHAEPVA